MKTCFHKQNMYRLKNKNPYLHSVGEYPINIELSLFLLSKSHIGIQKQFSNAQKTMNYGIKRPTLCK